MKKNIIAAVVMALAFCPMAYASPSYPSHPIRLVVPFPPGGTTDVIARVVARQVEKQIGQSIVVENKPGANGIIGIESVVNASPDGYTILHSSPSVISNEFIYKKLRYNADRDLMPITNIGTGLGYILLVRPDSPLKTLNDLVSAAKAAPEAVSYGSAGIGNTTHLVAELMSTHIGIKMLHVPYKGIAESMQATMSGQVDVTLVPPTQALKLVQSGQVRALAFSGERRWKQLPEVPTFKESGLSSYSLGWFSWFAPSGTDSGIVNRLQSEVSKALQAPDVKNFIETGGFEVDGRKPDEIKAFLKSERTTLEAAVKAARIPPQ